ncbi:MAG: hypothetical protein ACKVP5_01835 [Aestuariivirga sp.]
MPCPFRPSAAELKAIHDGVSEIADIQRTLVNNHANLQVPDRVAHQYQIAGGPVIMRIADELPPNLTGLGLFVPGTEHFGIGRVSTGLGTPHSEAQPDFLGLRFSFLADGRQIDFLSINDPAAPTDTHTEFVDLLFATGHASAAGGPFQLAEEQARLLAALTKRMGLVGATRTATHVVRQTFRTFRSSTAVQPYWTGIFEAGGSVGKFSFVPEVDDNHSPGLHAAADHLTRDWQARQKAGDINFTVYWIPFVDEKRTSTSNMTDAWQEDGKSEIATIRFPAADLPTPDALLWAALAAEMVARPGNWLADTAGKIGEPPTAFEIARKAAYQLSQRGRDALELRAYEDVFGKRKIGAALRKELERRRDDKARLGHVSEAAV